MNRDFKGIWIPREIWLAQNLSCIEKCVWAEIHSLFDRERGGCYASNEYLMEFFGLKDRRLREIVYKLRDLGWVKEVSFDGRNRVIKAVIPPEDFKPEVRAKQTGGKVPPCVAEKCQAEGQENANPSLYIEQSVVTTLDPPSIPPVDLPKENAAKAAVVDGAVKSSKPKREKSDFSPKVRETGQALLNVLLQAKADFKVPTNLFSFLTEVDYMIRTDKRDPQKLIDVLRWGLSDPYQGPWFFCPNPAKKLRQKYDAIDMKMNAKPAKNPNEVDRRLRDKEGNVSDEWKDHIF
jgi:hypothetical protein